MDERGLAPRLNRLTGVTGAAGGPLPTTPIELRVLRGEVKVAIAATAAAAAESAEAAEEDADEAAAESSPPPPCCIGWMGGFSWLLPPLIEARWTPPALAGE